MNRTKIYTDLINNDLDNFSESYQQLINFYPKFNHELAELNQVLDSLEQKHNIFLKIYHYLKFRRLNRRFHQHDVIAKALKLRFIISLFTTQRHFELLQPYLQLSRNHHLNSEKFEKIQTQLTKFVELTENPDFFDPNLIAQLRYKIETEITLQHIQDELENHQ